MNPNTNDTKAISPDKRRKRKNTTMKRNSNIFLKHHNDETSSTGTPSTVSVASTCSLSSCDSPVPTSEVKAQHLEISPLNLKARLAKVESTKKNKSKKNGKKKPSSKQNKNRKGQKAGSKKSPSKQPQVVEVEEITEEEKSRYVAIDCEMVAVESDYGSSLALARVSIVNWYGEVLLDTHVQVDEHVVDYLTFVSGITQEDLESEEALTFYDCRVKVQNMIRNKVVVGHALRNDFNVLQLSHPWHLTRDTARYEPFMKACKIEKGKLLPKKLKVLAKDKLGMIIQEDGKEHDSIEDATAAMDLYKKARRKWEKAVSWKKEKTDSINAFN